MFQGQSTVLYPDGAVLQRQTLPALSDPTKRLQDVTSAWERLEGDPDVAARQAALLEEVEALFAQLHASKAEATNEQMRAIASSFFPTVVGDTSATGMTQDGFGGSKAANRVTVSRFWMSDAAEFPNLLASVHKSRRNVWSGQPHGDACGADEVFILHVTTMAGAVGILKSGLNMRAHFRIDKELGTDDVTFLFTVYGSAQLDFCLRLMTGYSEKYAVMSERMAVMVFKVSEDMARELVLGAGVGEAGDVVDHKAYSASRWELAAKAGMLDLERGGALGHMWELFGKNTVMTQAAMDATFGGPDVVSAADAVVQWVAPAAGTEPKQHPRTNDLTPHAGWASNNTNPMFDVQQAVTHAFFAVDHDSGKRVLSQNLKVVGVGVLECKQGLGSREDGPSSWGRLAYDARWAALDKAVELLGEYRDSWVATRDGKPVISREWATRAADTVFGPGAGEVLRWDVETDTGIDVSSRGRSALLDLFEAKRGMSSAAFRAFLVASFKAGEEDMARAYEEMKKATPADADKLATMAKKRASRLRASQAMAASTHARLSESERRMFEVRPFYKAVNHAAHCAEQKARTEADEKVAEKRREVVLIRRKGCGGRPYSSKAGKTEKHLIKEARAEVRRKNNAELVREERTTTRMLEDLGLVQELREVAEAAKKVPVALDKRGTDTPERIATDGTVLLFVVVATKRRGGRRRK